MRLIIEKGNKESKLNYGELGGLLTNLQGLLIEGIDLEWGRVKSVNIAKAVIDCELEVEGYEGPVVLTNENDNTELLQLGIKFDEKGRLVIGSSNEYESYYTEADRYITGDKVAEFKTIQSEIGYLRNTLLAEKKVKNMRVKLFSYDPINEDRLLVKRYYQDGRLIQEVSYKPKDDNDYTAFIEEFKNHYGIR